MEFRDLKRQYSRLQPEMDEALLTAVRSGAYIMGKPVKELEAELAAYVGVKHCLTCGNGTDALLLALKALGIGKGDAVYVPDFTFFASAEVVAEVGATPIFVDVNETTFNISIESLQAAHEAVQKQGKLKPRAIIPVDLFGLPADYSHLVPFAQREGLQIVEDAAQGFGGSIDGQRACSFGNVGCTSFFPAKPLGCYGDGGAIFTNNDSIASMIESLRVHGKGSEKYDNVRIGMNSRLDTVQAAVLRVKLKAFQREELKLVKQAAKLYNEHLDGIGLQIPVIPQGYISSWAQYTIVLPKEYDRTALQAHLKERGIPSMVYYPRPMHLQTAFAAQKHPVECPVTERLSKCVLSLPMHPYIEEAEVLEVCTAIRNLL